MTQARPARDWTRASRRRLSSSRPGGVREATRRARPVLPSSRLLSSSLIPPTYGVRAVVILAGIVGCVQWISGVGTETIVNCGVGLQSPGGGKDLYIFYGCVWWQKN